jgi:ribosomal protein S18 acetylase RimI-like enzyme
MPHRIVSSLKREQARDAAALLGRAFCDNPGVCVVLDRHGREERQRLMTRAAYGFVQASLRHGEATAVIADGRLAAVSLVYPPGTYPPSVGAMFWMSLGPLRSSPRTIFRYARFDAYMRSRHVRAPHYYLFMLGCEPDLQGRGHGGALLRALNERVDGRGVLAYLETDKAENVGLYQRFGYEVTTDQLVLGTCRLWTMTRPVKAA